MFFRMIKKDLKESKGLNAIILLFMVIVTTLVAASALLMLANVRGVRVSIERTKPYDAFAYYTKLLDKSAEQEKSYEDIILSRYPDARIEHIEGIEFDYLNIEYEGVDYDALNKIHGFHRYALFRQPRAMNLIYDLDNEPFYVKNGDIAIPYSFAMETGLKIGDDFYITAKSGKKFGFKISQITRDPIHDGAVRFIISDADYEVMSVESPQKLGCTGFDTDEEFGMNEMSDINARFSKNEEFGDYYQGILMDGHTTSNSALVSMLVVFFLMITCIFMILIIMLTIGFTIKSAIKKEERELGIMKALGTDSVSFRWLVAAKYVAFSVIGGAIGTVAGIVVGDMLIGRFYFNISYSLGPVDYVVAVVSAILIIGLVILFILLSMRRINKISVMDVLHGEARHERMRHSDRFRLSQRTKMPLPVFLALSDIFGNFKRYILLFFAFMIGSIVVLMNIQIRDSTISSDFLYKFYTYKPMEAALNLSDTDFHELSSATLRADIFLRNLTSRLKENGIDANVDIREVQNIDILVDNGSQGARMSFGFDPEGMVIRKGGQYPKLRNEVLIDYHTADEYGLQIGDKITIRYDRYTPDRLSTEVAEEAFIITGFVDRLSAFNGRDVIMSGEFEDARSEGWDMIGFSFNGPDASKKEQFAKLNALYPGQVMTDDKLIASNLAMYDSLFTFMRDLMVVVATVVLGFLVVMYQTIFMKDDESEIALLMSTGVDEKSTARWQVYRMMIIFVAAIVLSIILAPTLGATFLAGLFNAWLGLTGYTFTRGVLKSILWTVFIAVIIGTVVTVVVKKIRDIEIWRIRNE